MAGRSGRVAAHVVVEDLTAPALDLDPEDARHLSAVLRLRPGEPVGATDGRGGYLPCVYSGSGCLSPAGSVVVAPPRVPAVTVGFVPVKGDRPEWAVQKLTELGVDRIMLLSSARQVVRWDGARLPSHLGRLRRVARGAVMQSRQVWLPVVEGMVPVGELAPVDGCALAEKGGAALPASVHTVLIGPEGGWDEEELSGAPLTVGLGDTVLRAETAAVAAGVLLTARRSGLVA